MTLADLKAGARAVIVAIDAHDPAVQRLMTLGLIEGVEVEFMQSSLGGDPIEIRVNGAAISLRRAQARAFTVEPSSR
jgi:Fe2+ transport system protein FeoA